MATRRGLFSFFSLPLWLNGTAKATPDDGSIMINPRDLWLREIVYQWLNNAAHYEQDSAKSWSTIDARITCVWLVRDDVVYLSEILAAGPDELKQIFVRPWTQMLMGSTSHIDYIARTLQIYEDDGRLRLHLNPTKSDFRSHYAPDIQHAYTKVFPIIKALITPYPAKPQAGALS